MKKSNASDKCGFFRINRESVVPYTVKDTIKYVPLFYFEGETDHLKLKSDKVEGWDLAYLKFCCKVQGIRNELFAADTCRVVALEEIKGHFPSGTTFEDYWPAKGSIEPVHHSQRVSAGNWTQKPVSVVPQNAQNQPQNQRGSVADAAAAAALQSSLLTGSARGQSNYPAAQPAISQSAAMANYAQQLTAAAQRNYVEMFQRATSQHSQHQLQQLQQQFQRQQAQVLAAYGAAAGSALLNNSALTGSGQQQRSSTNEKAFNGKLTQIKEFPMEQSHQPPYKLQKALIDQKIVPCINVRPYVFHDLMMTLPDFVKHFYPDLSIETARQMLQDSLKVVLYKGNR